MSKGSREGLIALWPKYGIEFQDHPLDYAQIFGSDSPIVLEVGFGMGTATGDMAASDPNTMILAVDVHGAGISSLMRRCERDGLTNVRVIRDDAVRVLESMISPESLDGFRLYFPDPWPKVRHNKRRFVRPDLTELVVSRLKPGATFHSATDWVEYAEQMLEVLDACPQLENNFDGFAPRPHWRPVTAFEKAGTEKGHQISDVIYTKKK